MNRRAGTPRAGAAIAAIAMTAFALLPFAVAVPVRAQAQAPSQTNTTATAAPTAPANDAPVAVGAPAPAFRLPDDSGRARTLEEWRGHPVALFFFCGCARCAEAAAAWAGLNPPPKVDGADRANGAKSADAGKAKQGPSAGRGKNGGTTAPAATAPVTVPVIVIVFAGSAAEAKALAATAGLSGTGGANVVLLPDPDLRVSDGLYHAEPCPRALVLDRRGAIRFSTLGRDENPQETPGTLLAARAHAALRAVRDEEREADRDGERRPGGKGQPGKPAPPAGKR